MGYRGVHGLPWRYRGPLVGLHAPCCSVARFKWKPAAYRVSEVGLGGLDVGIWGLGLASLNRSFARLLMVTRTDYMLLCCENGGFLERRSSPATFMGTAVASLLESRLPQNHQTDPLSS